MKPLVPMHRLRFGVVLEVFEERRFELVRVDRLSPVLSQVGAEEVVKHSWVLKKDL